MALPLRPITGDSVVFSRKGCEGDFVWMLKQPQYANTLFIIAENFIDSIREDAEAGGGTAVLRPYSMYHRLPSQPVRAAGVPTGWSTAAGGFSQMDNDVVRRAIDLSIERIVILLDKLTHFTSVIFSADRAAPSMIGTGIFKKTLGADVVAYISKQLHDLPNRPPSTTTMKLSTDSPA